MINGGAESSRSERASQESENSIAGDSIERKSAHRVMTTRQPRNFTWHSAPVEFIVSVPREFWKKRQIIAARDHQTTPVGAAKFLDKRIWADRRPKIPQLLKVNRAFK